LQERLGHHLWRCVTDFVDGDESAAVADASELFALSESEGHVRLFLDAGPPAHLLLVAAARAEPSGYAASLLRAQREARVASATSSVGRSVLSARERAVLGHLANRLTYAEIADRLFVSQNTVKSHAKSVYTKLGVSGRRRAVERAQELGLL
jgi:LuxR family maltose regulon positive regulatory protein